MVRHILLLSFFIVGFNGFSQQRQEAEFAAVFDDSHNAAALTHNDGREKWKKVEVPNKRTLLMNGAKHRKTHRPIKF